MQWDGASGGSASPVLPERPSGAMEDAFRGGDAAGPARRLGIDGDRERTLEQDVALDAHAERQAQGRHFRQAERSQFGLAEIGETEQGVAVLVEFGRQPGADAERLEEADDRSEEPTFELQSLIRIPFALFCSKK